MPGEIAHVDKHRLFGCCVLERVRRSWWYDDEVTDFSIDLLAVPGVESNGSLRYEEGLVVHLTRFSRLIKRFQACCTLMDLLHANAAAAHVC